MKKSRRTLISKMVILAILATAILLFHNPLIALEKVVLFSGPSGNFAPVFVAQSKGFGKEEGIDFAVKVFTSGAEATEGFRAGKAQFLSAGDVPSIYLLSGGDSLALAPFAVNRDSELIIGGPKIKKPMDIKGKKVALVRKSAAEYMLYLYLKKLGLTLGDVEMVPLAPFDQIPALIKGDVDAISSWKPLDLKITAIGGPQFSLLANGVTHDYHVYGIIATQKEYAKNNPIQVKAVLRSIWKACNWMNDAPYEETVKLVSDYLKSPIEDEKHTMYSQFHSITETRRYRKQMKDIETFLFEQKYLSQKIDWGAALGTSFLKEISPCLVETDK